MARSYWIGHISITDPEMYEEYKSANAVTFSKYVDRFIWALQATVVSAEEQVESDPPFADLLSDLIEKYDTWSTSYQHHFSDNLHPELSREFSELREMAKLLTNSVFKSLNRYPRQHLSHAERHSHRQRSVQLHK